MQHKYEIVIYWSPEDSAYLAEVPELPGCMADGSSYQDALKNAEVIIQEWIETALDLGCPIPEARGKLMYAYSGRQGFCSPGSHSTPHAGPHGARPPDVKGPP